MNIKIGEYARLNNTLYNTVVILKIMEVYDNTILTENDGSIFQGEYGKDEIIKHSYSIIDLIEDGDYVNGYLIEKVYDVFETSPNKLKEAHIRYADEDFISQLYDTKINSIVTKEQFSSIEYKVRNSNEKN